MHVACMCEFFMKELGEEQTMVPDLWMSGFNPAKIFMRTGKWNDEFQTIIFMQIVLFFGSN